MPVYYDINGSLFAEDEYMTAREAFSSPRARGGVGINLGPGRTMSVPSLPTLKLSSTSSMPAIQREFEPIGIGKPLTLWIASAYVGKLPPKNWLGGKGCLLSSAVKSWSYQDAQPRALNAIKQDVGRQTELQFAANEVGTRLAFYSPALVDRQLSVTFEMAFDDVDEDFYKSVSGVMSAAGAIPAFASASPYLLAASALVNIGSKIANGLYDSKAEFQATETLNIDLPGNKPQEGYRLIARDELDRKSLADYGISDGRLLKKDGSGTAYGGDTPYVIVALDGTTDPALKNFSANAASASLLEKYYNIRENGETSADAIIQALKLFNDFKYNREAADLKKSIDGGNLSQADKDNFTARYNAIVKNIYTDEFKPK
ncbi:hypothetical protein L2Y96_19165 [Luteibacter aegosomaticola]|uniref:hypothetical protein n=1 Tax=Luteibacter aegosomaticola TaxID=2911538 RepID=UPI001FF81656|nr:hypothetical protein [Luteibacter aegosomaticola]UPG89493.1 hypothetical protein L2Y96_19165 [Luteibacter aegosomaticola]